MKQGAFVTIWSLGLCLAALLLGAAFPAWGGSATYRVVSGDSIRSILLRHNCVRSMAGYSQLREEFARLNPTLLHSGLLVAGQDIRIPRDDTTGACLKPAPARVVRVEFEAGATSEKIRVYLDGPVLPDLFMLKKPSPRRLVCDFDETLPREGLQREIQTKGRLVRKIRIGHEDKPFHRARVVLELEESLAGQVEQLFFEQESLFVLTVREAFE